MRIVFMGTPDFAVEALKALIKANHEICCVLTGEDKPRGRGHEMMHTPVKALATSECIEVMQPSSLRDERVFEKLSSYNADVFVVVAYGKILPKPILDIPTLGCINIHASLLPAYRGAAPIQWAIIDGCKRTGITTMLMDEGLDTGDILRSYELDIEDCETGGSLFDKLSMLGGYAIVDTLEHIDEIIPRKQKEASTAYAAMLTKEFGNIDFTKKAVCIERLVRGLNPWPSAYSYLDNKMIKLWKVRVCKRDVIAKSKSMQNVAVGKELGSLSCVKDLEPGTLIRDNGRLYVMCADGLLEIVELQLQGKRRMKAEDFLRGYKLDENAKLLRA